MTGSVQPALRSLTSADELELLRPLWLALHQHHRAVSDFRDLVDDDEASWIRRRELYAGWLEDGSAMILLAERDEQAIAYATVHFVDGPDDTFAVGDRYAELYSLSVAIEHRGAGVGSLLMDAIETRLATMGITDLTVSVMAGNERAQRFYEGRGLQPAEVLLWRIGRAPR